MTNPRTQPVNDKERALTNPSGEFDKPKDIVADATMSKQEKKKALKEWELDARLMQVATEEGMSGGEPDRLREVKKAQAELNEKTPDKGPPVPNKSAG